LLEIEQQETAEMEWQLSQTQDSPPVPQSVQDTYQKHAATQPIYATQPPNSPVTETSSVQEQPGTDYDLPAISPSEVNSLVNQYSEPEPIESTYAPPNTTYEPVNYDTPLTSNSYVPQQIPVDYSALGWLIILAVIFGIFTLLKRKYAHKKATLITVGLVSILTVMGNFEAIMSWLDEIPATKIFFLVATVVLITFAVPLWKRLNKSI
jgi:hypothetical protein